MKYVNAGSLQPVRPKTLTEKGKLLKNRKCTAPFLTPLIPKNQIYAEATSFCCNPKMKSTLNFSCKNPFHRANRAALSTQTMLNNWTEPWVCCFCGFFGQTALFEPYASKDCLAYLQNSFVQNLTS